MHTSRAVIRITIVAMQCLLVGTAQAEQAPRRRNAGESPRKTGNPPSEQMTPLSPEDMDKPVVAHQEIPATQPAAEEPHQWYYPPKAVSALQAREPVDYARPMSLWSTPGCELPPWILFGIEQRTRYEYLDDNYRRNLDREQPILMRSRVFIGIEEVLDPFRFGIEFQDSRQFGTLPAPYTENVDENDFLQAYGELYFKNAVGQGQPLSFQFGRMSLDYVDRRLRSRNGFRNTTNAFDGFRIHAGNQDTQWEAEFFAVQPVEIRLRQPDVPDETQWLYGIVGAWRGWAPLVTMEPYYLILDVDNKGWQAQDTELHTFGMRTYGEIVGTGFDYDIDAAFQAGHSRGLRHRAYAAHAELAYTFEHPWHPRLAGWVNYASGDRDPFDRGSQQFNRMFGSSNGPYSPTDYFQWSNMIQPVAELRFEPIKNTSISLFYRANWLASDSDAWIRGGRVDTAGQSGDFVGQELDIFLRHRVNEHLSIELGFAHFMPGAFVRNTGDSPDSDRFFVQTTLRF